MVILCVEKKKNEKNEERKLKEKKEKNRKTLNQSFKKLYRISS
jgi:hypothetical protein